MTFSLKSNVLGISVVILGCVFWSGASNGQVSHNAPPFTAKQLLGEGSEGSLAVGDVDGDGDTDVVFGRDGAIYWFEIENAQVIAEHLVFDYSSAGEFVLATAITLVDADGSGLVDIVWIEADVPGNYWFRIATNDDSAQPYVTNLLDVGVPQPVYRGHAICAADIDVDGDDDLVVAYDQDFETGRIELLTNVNPQSAVFALSTVATGVDRLGEELAIGDLDGDRDLDIAALSRVLEEICWFEQASAAPLAFQSRVIQSLEGTLQPGDWPSQLELADIDGDGTVEAIVGFRLDGAVRAYDQPTSVEMPFVETAIFGLPGGGGIRDIRAIDINNDATEDLLVNVGGLRSLYTLRFEPGAWPPPMIAHCVSSTIVGSLEAADLDLDGDQDIVTAISGQSGLLFWMRNDFNVWPRIVFAANQITEGGGFQVSKPSDLDGDGDLDFAAGDIGDVDWYENRLNESGGFVRHWIENGFAYLAIEVVDIDQDLDLDILSSDAARAIRLHLNNGDVVPAFTSQTVFDPEKQIGPSAGAAFAMPGVGITGSNAMDFATVTTDAPVEMCLWIHENDGQSPPQFASAPAQLGMVSEEQPKVADIDGDGLIDVVTVDENGLLWVNRQLPGSTFENIQLIGAPSSTGAVAIGDFDGDLDLDIAAGRFLGSVFWMENQGAPGVISFAFRQIWPSGTNDGQVRELNAGDIDGDGDVDLVAAVDGNVGKEGDPIRWYENVGANQPKFVMHIVSTQTEKGQQADLGDLDLDGEIDIVGAINQFGGIHWFENLKAPLGDLNDDGQVDGFDLATLLSVWGSSGHSGADLNGDGVVNGADLATLLANWNSSAQGRRSNR